MTRRREIHFRCAAAVTFLVLTAMARAEVQVFVQGSNTLAYIKYQCTGGEVVRAFALDVTVDRGQIIGVSNYFRGLSTAAAQGYGVFPASFRDNVPLIPGSNAVWSISAYSPLAVPSDDPSGTQPGLNSSGVTLECGAIWDESVPGAFPPAQGVLCSLQLSQAAQVSVAPNLARGGIVASPPDLPLATQFRGATVGPAITGATITSGTIIVQFQAGELETAPSVNGPWTRTGLTNGTYTETVAAGERYFRVDYH